MPGNEINLVKFLVQNKNHIKLKHLNGIEIIQTPTKTGLMNLETEHDVDLHQKEDSRSKKADIYINGQGISLKQTGGSKAYNKFRRELAEDFFNFLGFDGIQHKIDLLDKAIKQFHDGQLKSRNYPWENIFSNSEYKKLLSHLMMIGNQNSFSDHQAKLIITSDKIPSHESLKVYTFEEYFESHKKFSSLAIRRIWTNQASKSESNRAKRIAAKPQNSKWVFNNIVGEPRNGFNQSEKIKKTVYYLDIEIKY